MYCSVVIFSRPLEPLSYALPMPAEVGVVVQVPLGRRSCTGIITAITDQKPDYRGTIRRILEVVDPTPVISGPLMATLRFMAQYYGVPLGFCLKLAMPGGMMRAGACYYHAGRRDGLPESPCVGDKKPEKSPEKTLFDEAVAPSSASETPLVDLVFDALRASACGLTETELRKRFKFEGDTFSRWVAAGVLVPEWRLDAERSKETTEACYAVTDAEIPKRFGRKQQEIYAWIKAQGGTAKHSAVLAQFGSCSPMLHRLEELGLIATTEVARNKTSFDSIVPIVHDIVRTEEQEAAVQAVVSHQGYGGFLLFGVTGSGKTEVYLGVMEAIRARGKGCIFVLPEIALTPQFCAVFKGRFGDDVAVLHSGLGESERFDTWTRIREGRIHIAIGPRSALFAPVRDLGLIVIDEEHDSSFKQGETPRYHTRDMALFLGMKCGCPVILGSATPSLESYTLALTGRLKMLTLTRRPQARPMPDIHIVDMRNRPKPEIPEGMDEEGKADLMLRNRLLSDALIQALHETLGRGEQAIIFLNRRGFSTFIQCDYCGYVMRCPNCDVALTYYKYSGELHCHYCDYVDRPGGVCPRCNRSELNFTGYGTERLVSLLEAELPGARIDRLDRDRATVRGIQRVLDAFRNGELDILVGTQMIAKGHDIHNVTLVGIINADMGLNMPDFRASERTYQLLTQVSGRAGRGDHPGRVILQTLMPDHPAIRGVIERDYVSFAAQEIEIRRALSYPPFAYMVMIRFEGEDFLDTERFSVRYAEIAQRQLRDMSKGRVLGPAPSPIPMLCSKARYQLFLRHQDRGQLHAWLGDIMRQTAELCAAHDKIRVIVDVDPYDML
ncbi:MAG: primosomal protein N' [Proteobacteria bacterium]|nr:primosomal protein N' [Pseudomonadota bacterium]